MKKEKHRPGFRLMQDENGATAFFIAVCIMVLISFAALAIDIGQLVVTKNELQNAADAGALAGANGLYNENGTELSPANARAQAVETAQDNRSFNIAVEVNPAEVLVGHWSFGLEGSALTRGFHENESTELPVLYGREDYELDGDINFINAVQITARRQATGITAWFARIFGINEFQQSATAVAYIGYAGSVGPLQVDQPIAICEESLRMPGSTAFECNIGRMLNSGERDGNDRYNTGGWTDFNQQPNCEGVGASPDSGVRDLVCQSNPVGLDISQMLSTNGGVMQDSLSTLYDCWMGNRGLDSNSDGTPNLPWNMRLPVISCPDNNVGSCSRIVGMVEVQLVWIQNQNVNENEYQNAPQEMLDWPSRVPVNQTVGDLISATPLFQFTTRSNTGINEIPQSWANLLVTDVMAGSDLDDADVGKVRWASFVNYFRLRNYDGSPAPFQGKALYFLPDCTFTRPPTGDSQGGNFNVLARSSVLVN
jgi:hypothetical protein